jgi:hypothetical protein
MSERSSTCALTRLDLPDLTFADCVDHLLLDLTGDPP